MADHYAVLGVQPDADRAAIQAAYRMLARLHHPDFGGDGSRMAALNEAWSVLGRHETRLAYDATRGYRRSSGAAPAAPDATPPPAPTGPIGTAAARRSTEARGRTLGFGRYAEWTIAELAAHDPDYLEWLARAPAGLTFRQEIYTQLAKRAPVASGRTATATRPQPGSRFRRRLW
jgi:curved DNA-binding protein CbpA